MYFFFSLHFLRGLALIKVELSCFLSVFGKKNVKIPVKKKANIIECFHLILLE